MRRREPCKLCSRCSVDARPGRSLRSAQRCWQCRRVFSLVCSNAVVHTVLLFQNICYSAVQRDLPFHTLVIFFPPFCVLYVSCTLLIIINSDWRQTWLPVSENVSPRKPNIAPLGTSCPRSAAAVPARPWRFQKVKHRDDDPSDVTTVVSTSCSCRHSVETVYN